MLNINNKRMRTFVPSDSVSSTLITSQAAVNATYVPNIPPIASNYTVENNLVTLLNQQAQLVRTENFVGAELNRVFPTIFTGGKREQKMEFNFVSSGVTKLSDYILQLKIPITGKTVKETVGADVLEVSDLPQSPFSFLNVIREVKAYFGSEKLDLFQDKTISKSILKMKAIMCSKKTSLTEAKIRCSAGISCSKFNQRYMYEDDMIYNYYNNQFLPLAAYNPENPGRTFSTTHTVTVFLKDLIPFFDSDLLLEPGIPISIELHFAYTSTSRPLFFFNTIYNPDALSVGAYCQLNTFAADFPIVNDNSNYITYCSYQLKEELQSIWNSLPKMIINTYEYRSYQLETTNENPGQKYIYDIPLIGTPVSALIYMSHADNQYAMSLLPYTTSRVTALYCNSNGFMAGINMTDLIIDASGVNLFRMTDNGISNVQNDGLVKDWLMDESGFTAFLNLNKENVDKEYGKTSPVELKLNMVENVIPVEIPLLPNPESGKDTRSLSGGPVNLRFTMGFTGTYEFTSDLFSPSSRVITNALPLGTVINILLKYPTQITLDKTTKQASAITWPLLLEDSELKITGNQFNTV